MPSLLLGTRNAGKVKEIKTILADTPWSFSSLNDFPHVGLAAEEGATYTDNAITKARFYASSTGLPALADDSGLEVNALAGAPGVFSARYAGENASDATRCEYLLEELAKRGATDRRARFVCVTAIASVDGEVLNVSEGICEGTITLGARGGRGFGYDPLFIPDGYDQTFAELTLEVKNRISHRARALLKTKQFLRMPQPSGRSTAW